MKKRLLLMALFITTVALLTQAAKPSGFVSLNLQETKPSLNPKVVYVSPTQHYFSMYSGVVNPSITMFNGMVTANGTRVPYTKSAIARMVDENAEASIDTLQRKLNSINANRIKEGKTPINGVTGTIDLRQVDSAGKPIWAKWLISHTYNGYVELNLQPGDSLSLMGRYGDTTQRTYGYVAHGEEAEGWYGILRLDDGAEFLLYRVACENIVRGLKWLQSGRAKVIKKEGENTFGDDGVEKDPRPSNANNGNGKTFINGKELVTSKNGDTYITINNNNNNSAVATGGKSNSVSSSISSNKGMVGTPNPNYSGGTPSTVYVQPAPTPSLVPNVQPYVPPVYYQQPYYSQPYYGYSQPYRPGISIGVSFGGRGGNDGGCFGGYPSRNQSTCNTGGANWPTYHPQPQPQPQGRFQSNGSGTFPGATQQQGGRFQSNGTGHL